MKDFIIWLSYYKDGQEKFTVQDVPGQSIFMTLFNDVIESLAGIYWFSDESSIPIRTESTTIFAELQHFCDEELDEREDNIGIFFWPFQLFPRWAR
ncbi:MAG: hypothetical protein GY869_14590 [Planctomycetes bacterium]|nr:hypothetical protein [Planctomycetota bacterium]